MVSERNSLFDDLLDISRMEFGQGQNIYEDTFDIKTLVQEVIDSVKHSADAKNIQIDGNSHSVNVYADRKRIGQVLTNLAQNAVNYMDKADGSVSIRYRRYKDKLRIEVIDTGCGISEANLERIFDRFFRVDKARSRDTGGTGLGLSISKKILEAHQEDLKVESTLGSGTRFWFELPLVDVEN
jgi:two-component system, OmpR family, phosphate regulon sensor histidine kinase PhoR